MTLDPKLFLTPKLLPYGGGGAGPQLNYHDAGCPTLRDVRSLGTTDLDPMFTCDIHTGGLRATYLACPTDSIATTVPDTCTLSPRVAASGELCSAATGIATCFFRFWSGCGGAIVSWSWDTSSCRNTFTCSSPNRRWERRPRCCISFRRTSGTRFSSGATTRRWKRRAIFRCP